MCTVQWSSFDRDPGKGMDVRLHKICGRFSVSRVLFFLHAPLRELLTYPPSQNRVKYAG